MDSHHIQEADGLERIEIADIGRQEIRPVVAKGSVIATQQTRKTIGSLSREKSVISAQQPGEVIRPVVGEGTVEEIVRKRYGMTVMEVMELNSYMDRNYYIQVDPQHSNPRINHLNADGYVVKIYNSKESLDLESFGAQHAMMSHFIKNNIPCQTPAPNLNGERYSLEIIYPDKKKVTLVECIVEMRTFIPGRIIQDVPYTIDLLVQVGRMMANIKQTLKHFDHPYYKTMDISSRLWSMTNVPLLTRFTFCLGNDDKEFIENIVSNFNARVVTRYEHLPRGYIHGDLNEQNILVSKDESGLHHTICGILDFTLAEYSYPVLDLVINMAYLMIDSDVVDQLDTPGYILAGYYDTESLTEDEWDVLVPCIAGKLAQSLTLGAHAHFIEPENAYVLTTAKKGWPLLKRYWSESESRLLSRWKNIISNYHS